MGNVFFSSVYKTGLKKHVIKPLREGIEKRFQNMKENKMDSTLVVEKRKKPKYKPHPMFVELEKAYDNVSINELLWDFGLSDIYEREII